jgi:hypothetical protein
MASERRVQESFDNFVPLRRRLRDLLADHALAQAQLQILQERAGPHHLRDVQQRIGAVHRRLDQLETALRERAEQHGIDVGLPIAEVRAQLGRAL